MYIYWWWELTYTNLIVQFEHVKLSFFAAKQMIFRLFYNGCHTVKLPAVCVGLHDFDWRPSGSAPIHHPALVYYVVHGPHHFCNVFNSEKPVIKFCKKYLPSGTWCQPYEQSPRQCRRAEDGPDSLSHFRWCVSWTVPSLQIWNASHCSMVIKLGFPGNFYLVLQ